MLTLPNGETVNIFMSGKLSDIKQKLLDWDAYKAPIEFSTIWSRTHMGVYLDEYVILDIECSDDHYIQMGSIEVVVINFLSKEDHLLNTNIIH